MQDIHLTTPLRRPPFSQYQVGSLELGELGIFAHELSEIEGDSNDSALQRYETIVRKGGQISIAIRTPALGAPLVEAIIIKEEDRLLVDGRYPDTPEELLGYLESTVNPDYQAPETVEILGRQLGRGKTPQA